MARRSVECFRAQTYQAKRLLVLVDSGCMPWRPTDLKPIIESDDTQIIFAPGGNRKSIGALRNLCQGFLPNVLADIVIHWDDDDWSHPDRIAEQVALLESTGAEAVGYNQMLFWRQEEHEAWLYTSPNRNYALGTSLCYWRCTWEQKPFPDVNVGEDSQWCAGLRVYAISALPGGKDAAQCTWWKDGSKQMRHEINAPRMIARIHAGNTSPAYNPDFMRMAQEWTRMPQWDDYCRERMAL